MLVQLKLNFMQSLSSIAKHFILISKEAWTHWIYNVGARTGKRESEGIFYTASTKLNELSIVENVLAWFWLRLYLVSGHKFMQEFQFCLFETATIPSWWRQLYHIYQQCIMSWLWKFFILNSIQMINLSAHFTSC